MNYNFIRMLEDIKLADYKGIVSYLTPTEIAMLRKWFGHFSDLNFINDEDIVSLVYELYIREDIDFRPCEKYNEIILPLADKYHFDSVAFLDMYRQCRVIIYGGLNEGE